MIIGLTGGTGTGKTSISEIFSNKGFKVINYDLISRQIYQKDSDCYREVVKTFGTSILDSDKEISRPKLGAIVFSDRESLDILNKIVYKYILSLTAKEIENSRGKMLLLDAPTLFEAGLNKKCDLIVGVVAKKELRKERICKRDGIDAQTAENRINSQKSDEFYKENCDFIIDNSYTKEELKEKTLSVINAILSEF